jgi:acyl-CoA thioester hydrolase
MEPINASVPFAITIAIEPSDIDVLGHVNNVVYLRWVQDAAVAHWRALTTPEEQTAVAWVVVRHEIDYRRPALPDDRILARTRVGTATRQTYERLTEILRESDGTVLASARTLWVPLDPNTGRPMQLKNELRLRFSVPTAE